MAEFWTQEQAISLCRKVEAIAPIYSCHVALTGGCLYKLGFRKDLDLLFYRVRYEAEIPIESLMDALQRNCSIFVEEGYDYDAWCIKATWHGRNIDCFFPENLKADQQYAKPVE